jgi:hypothetical protein
VEVVSAGVSHFQQMDGFHINDCINFEQRVFKKEFQALLVNLTSALGIKNSSPPARVQE